MSAMLGGGYSPRLYPREYNKTVEPKEENSILFKDNNFYGQMHIRTKWHHTAKDKVVRLSYSLNGHIDSFQVMFTEETPFLEIEETLTRELARRLAETTLSHLFETLIKEERELLNESRNTR